VVTVWVALWLLGGLLHIALPPFLTEWIGPISEPELVSVAALDETLRALRGQRAAQRSPPG
jgi:hypothetical protein